jgi:hypothetical protein
VTHVELSALQAEVIAPLVCVQSAVDYRIIVAR